MVCNVNISIPKNTGILDKERKISYTLFSMKFVWYLIIYLIFKFIFRMNMTLLIFLIKDNDIINLLVN